MYLQPTADAILAVGSCLHVGPPAHVDGAAINCRSYILPEDLEHFLPPAKAQQAFDLLDIDQDGRVTLHNIRDAVVQMYQVGPCVSSDT